MEVGGSAYASALEGRWRAQEGAYRPPPGPAEPGLKNGHFWGFGYFALDVLLLGTIWPKWSKMAIQGLFMSLWVQIIYF